VGSTISFEGEQRMRALPELIEQCRERGVKITPQRVAIFECLLGRAAQAESQPTPPLSAHPSAEELFHEVRERHPGLAFATVYNTLQLLRDLGEVREIVVDELRRRYELNAEPHQHAVCRRCHRIHDVRLPEAAVLAQARLEGLDFHVEDAAVEFVGVCGACARAANGQ
jgi:Fur family peroxide stress response transcriptional regulator